MKHELFMMLAISIIYARLNKSAQADAAVGKMWETCISFDEKMGTYYRYRSPLLFLCLPGKFGRALAQCIYRIANKVVRFN
jgi:hypothetical protein